jgi:hypothetical protein
MLGTQTPGRGDYRRCRTALRFERVNARVEASQSDKNAMLNLLAVNSSSAMPSGT